MFCKVDTIIRKRTYIALDIIILFQYDASGCFHILQLTLSRESDSHKWYFVLQLTIAKISNLFRTLMVDFSSQVAAYN